MEPEYETNNDQDLATKAGDVVRANPIPLVLGALFIGIVLGALTRSAEPRSRTDQWRGKLEDSEDYVRDLIQSLAKASKKSYKKSAAAVKDSLEQAAEAARDAESDYVDPASKWFRNLWKKCCG